MRIGIGIDTGGTYTDAVAYDFDAKKILETAKALTTKEDFSRGILQALEGISTSLLNEAEILSLSTTLATNACVENRGGNAKLIIFGGDKRVIDDLGAAYGLPPSDELYLQESYTTFSGVIEREPDWELFCKNIENGYEDLDCVGIVEINAMRTGASAEKQAKTLFGEKYDIPAICGHELFSNLNYLQRGSSALLNARLFPVIGEFMEAIKTAVSKRGIKAKLIIMRSDGSVMSEEFASLHPIETLLCGPAASALGGLRLCDETNGVVIDMGGTTTDISLIKGGVPVSNDGGVSLGKWKTFVNGLYNKTIGLGGDSAIHYTKNGIYLEEYRVVPLCVAASTYPVIIDNLRRLVQEERKHTKFLHEHLLLTKDIDESPRYTKEEKRLCAALKKGPLSLEYAAYAMGKNIFSIDAWRLVKEGIVQICGLTPTDIMHIKNDFSQYSTEASLLGAEYVAFSTGISVDKLCELVYREVKRKLYLNIIIALLENQNKHYKMHGVPDELVNLINNSFDSAEKCADDDFIKTSFSTEYSLIGTGAPIPVFLDDVAKMLNTRAVIAENYEVANAVGAITGNLDATHSVEITRTNKMDFVVFGNDETKSFREREDAEAFAVSQAEQGALKEVLARGAKGEITVYSQIEHLETMVYTHPVYLGSTVTARAVGGLFGE